MINYLKDNYEVFTNRELANHLGLTLTVTRNKLYFLGLKRMEMEYWTDEQVQFLKGSYKQIGDVELAEIYTNKWRKNKGWTKNHIEKKRRYLKLKRTKAELNNIMQRNISNGCGKVSNKKRWETTGQAPNGSIKFWKGSNGKNIVMIKINGEYFHWRRWIWEKKVGEIPKGMNVVFKDGNPLNYEKGIVNLELISDAEMSRRNSLIASIGLSDNFVAGTLSFRNPDLRAELKKHPEILEIKRQQLLLERSFRDGITKKTG